MRTLKWLIVRMIMQMKCGTSLMRNHEALSLGRSYPDNVVYYSHLFNSAQYLLVNMHHVVNGGQYVNQMGRSVDRILGQSYPTYNKRHEKVLFCPPTLLKLKGLDR